MLKINEELFYISSPEVPEINISMAGSYLYQAHFQRIALLVCAKLQDKINVCTCFQVHTLFLDHFRRSSWKLRSTESILLHLHNVIRLILLQEATGVSFQT